LGTSAKKVVVRRKLKRAVSSQPKKKPSLTRLGCTLNVQTLGVEQQ